MDGDAGRTATRRSLAGVAVPGVRLLYDSPAVLDRRLDRVAALGVGWLRFDAAWPEVEYSVGPARRRERARYDFTRIDRAVDAARARGLRVVLVLGGSAEWARPAGSDWNHGPADATARAGFAAFAAAVAGRYRARVDAYEIWNEPNLPGAWAPAPDPAAYLRLLAETHTAVRRADPSAVVLSGGTGGGTSGIDPLDWYAALYRGGLAAVSDGVAVHPYPDAGRPADSGEMARARLIRALMDAHGDGDTALWGTETGVATGGEHAASEDRQAALVTQILHTWREIHDAGPLLYYTLDDFAAPGREGHFGLWRAGGGPKPAYHTLRNHLVG